MREILFLHKELSSLKNLHDTSEQSFLGFLRVNLSFMGFNDSKERIHPFTVI